MLAFGFLGANLKNFIGFYAPATAVLLCYMMGLQNAIITKLSSAEIRTTHMTGNTTDLGIELGKLFYWNRDEELSDRVIANREKLGIHAVMIGLFVFGGFLGALFIARLAPPVWYGRIYTGAVGLYFVMVVCFAAAPVISVAAPALFLGGLFQALFAVMQSTLVYRSAPVEMLVT